MKASEDGYSLVRHVWRVGIIEKHADSDETTHWLGQVNAPNAWVAIARARMIWNVPIDVAVRAEKQTKEA